MIRASQLLIRNFSSLSALSPLDGRYLSKTTSLIPYFSEAALMKYRLVVQSQWLLHILKSGIITPDPHVTLDETTAKFQLLIKNFDLHSAERIKQIETTTNHDLKSVEYFIKENISHYNEYVHFCCTSEDINNLAYSLMLKDSLKSVVITKMTDVLQSLINKSESWGSHAMLAHTHGQAASPTTLGKEFANFAYRLANSLGHLKRTKIFGKFNGAVGNYNAHYFAYPNLNWRQISQSFVETRLGLTFNPYTTQIQSHDSLCRVFTEIGTYNTILIGLSKDSWEYISKGYIKQKAKQGQVGSSTMPHKVNPIDFQNCEGNLGVANSLIDHFRTKLPISRQQRDLSDSTVLRNQGAALGYSLIAYDSLLKGLGKVDSNQQLMKRELTEHLEVITQAIQTQLRKIGYPEPYQLLKKLSRGKSFDSNTMNNLLKQLHGNIPEQSYKKLQALRPQNYLGQAETLSREISSVCQSLIN